MSTSLNKRRIGLGLTALIALLWLVAFWTGRQPAQPSAAVGPLAASLSPTAHTTPGRPPPAAAPKLASLRPADLIASVELDKRELCPGEDFLVTLHGKPENARSALPIAELGFNIDGAFGDQIVLNAREPGTQQHSVVASNGVDKIEYRQFSVEVLEPSSAACSQRALARVSVQRLAHDPNQIEARVTATQGLDEAVAYSWDFGDGAHAETTEPRAQHSYALRDQSRGMSSFVVSVLVSDRRGRSVEGRAGVHLVNTHQRGRAFGQRLVAAVYERWPRKAQGGHAFDVTFRSFEVEPVTFTRATLKQRSCARGQSERVQQLSPSQIGVPEQFEAKETRAAKLVIPAALVSDDTCVLELELSGDTVPARTGQQLPDSPIRYAPVTSRLAFELRAAAPADHGGAKSLASQRVQDPALVQKLRRAMEILGSQRVTPEQLAELERQGKLAPR